MSLILNGDGSIQSLNAGGLPTGTVTQATLATGVAGTGPAFSAYASANQTINAGATTKVVFGTEVFDTNSNFASSTFTPTVAGYYQINATVSIGIATGYIEVWKNGAAYNRGFQTQSAVVGLPVSTLVYCNGTTDYIEIYLSNQTASNQAINNVQSLTWFNGSMVRAA